MSGDNPPNVPFESAGAIVQSSLSRRRFLEFAALGIGTAALAGPLTAGTAEAASCAVPGSISFANASVPFSFVYGGQPSAQLLATWARTDTITRSDSVLTATTITWTSPLAAGAQLQVRCDVVQYHDYPTTEWTIWFQNLGTSDSLQLQKVLALDTWVQRTATQQFLVHANAGSTSTDSDFAPQGYLVEPSDSWRLFNPVGGRATNGALSTDTASALVGGGFPYFNVDLGDGSGFVVALGWPGQWSVEMRRENTSTGLHLLGCMNSTDTFSAGDYLMENTQLLNTSLHGGEQIRTPRIVMQFWACADWIAAQNTWRRWMNAHNSPLILGASPLPIASTLANLPFGDTIGEQLAWLNTTIANRAPAALGGSTDYWWRDAGWYDGGAPDWQVTGTWVPDPIRYPNTPGTLDGLSPMTDLAHDNGLRSIVWHEPERARPGTDLAINHPSWLLSRPGNTNLLVDLGNPDALDWAVDRFDDLIVQGGIDLFRQDFNIDPLPWWNLADTAGRSGMTQVRYVMGLLSFWDQLRSRHPGLIIDLCASGGRRLDLESLRRGVPLLRSDQQFDPAGQQAHTFGLSQWLPYHGTGEYISNPTYTPTFANEYIIRSGFCPALTAAVTSLSAPDTDWETFLRMTAEWAEIAPNLLGDYYPLTSYSLSANVWMAMQFDRPEVGEGAVLAYRRPSNGASGLTLALRGITTSPGTMYEVEDFYAGTLVSMTGSALAALTVTLPPGAGTSIRYRKQLPYSSVIQQAGPVGWWRLGDGAGSSSIADSSGNTLTGTATSVTLGATGAITGDTNTAATLNGTSSHINIGNPSQLQLSACSVEAWVKTTNTAHAGQAVCIKWYAYGLFLGDGAPALFDWSTATRHQCGPDAFVADGQWHHIVLTFQSGIVNGTKIYVDGILRLVTTITVANNTHNVIIGAGNIPATTDWYQGTVDEVAIYPRVLTKDQIQRHYNAGQPAPPYARTIANDRPVGWWRLGDGAGSSSIADSSGNGLTGTATSVTLGAAGAIAGDANTAATLNGTSSHINIGNPSQLQLSACSVEAWVKTTNTAHPGQAVCIKWYAYGLFLVDGAPALFDWSNATVHQCGPDAFVADGQWHHIVLTFQSGIVNGTKIYVDGILRLVTTITVANNTHNVIIGAGNIPATTDWYQGTVDEVAIYPRVLTGAQVKAHYRAGTGS